MVQAWRKSFIPGYTTRQKKVLLFVYTCKVAIRQTVKYCPPKKSFAVVGQFKVRNEYVNISNTIAYLTWNCDGVSQSHDAITNLDKYFICIKMSDFSSWNLITLPTGRTRLLLVRSPFLCMLWICTEFQYFSLYVFYNAQCPCQEAMINFTVFGKYPCEVSLAVSWNDAKSKILVEKK